MIWWPKQMKHSSTPPPSPMITSTKPWLVTPGWDSLSLMTSAFNSRLVTGSWPSMTRTSSTLTKMSGTQSRYPSPSQWPLLSSGRETSFHSQGQDLDQVGIRGIIELDPEIILSVFQDHVLTLYSVGVKIKTTLAATNNVLLRCYCSLSFQVSCNKYLHILVS